MKKSEEMKEQLKKDFAKILGDSYGFVRSQSDKFIDDIVKIVMKKIEEQNEKL